jgi:hypothetical protein
LQRYLGLFGASGALVVLFAACGGKVVVDAPSATGGGNGGAGGESSSTIYDGPFSAVGPSAVSVVASSGVTTGSGMSCVTCSQALTDPDADPGNLCQALSAPLYNELFGCVCKGLCAKVCGANACMGQAPSDTCSACVSDTSLGCGFELNNCLDDT